MQFRATEIERNSAPFYFTVQELENKNSSEFVQGLLETELSL